MVDFTSLQWYTGYVSTATSVRIKSYINMCLDLHVHVPIQYLECVGRAALFTFSVSEQAPYIYMYIQFFIMYMYIVTWMFCWVLFIYCWLMDVFSYRPFLLECPCRDVRYTMARLLERIMSSHFRHGGVPVSWTHPTPPPPHPQFNFSKKLFSFIRTLFGEKNSLLFSFIFYALNFLECF